MGRRYKPDATGAYSTENAMKASEGELSQKFFMQVGACTFCALCFVGGAFLVMNTWLNSLPETRGVVQAQNSANLGDLGSSAALGGGGGFGGAGGGFGGSPFGPSSFPGLPGVGGGSGGSAGGQAGVQQQQFAHPELGKGMLKAVPRVKHYHVKTGKGSN
mmetsp:Transcript_26724/g.41819  ORF Transcript_26724/g.41819 Transcript_26724/m.41819 type:complete len:160 (+) Transcript_26724:29-508(+)|eukprot:CAMPEP_0184299376 /NCGR_PEP_ID=MMETSP1049-20130417/10000_1 /TAXON_ID=77928 /ORGANISM="Proteomonas sulcata, Strain CCMP704" /LENGTH=159 /DNA_ID=CAMNT_0026609795 /DNA_START=18 /DNA_END=497 /DNA_ORIENTATION=-